MKTCFFRYIWFTDFKLQIILKQKQKSAIGANWFVKKFRRIPEQSLFFFYHKCLVTSIILAFMKNNQYNLQLVVFSKLGAWKHFTHEQNEYHLKISMWSPSFLKLSPKKIVFSYTVLIDSLSCQTCRFLNSSLKLWRNILVNVCVVTQRLTTWKK